MCQNMRDKYVPKHYQLCETQFSPLPESVFICFFGLSVSQTVLMGLSLCFKCGRDWISGSKYIPKKRPIKSSPHYACLQIYIYIYINKVEKRWKYFHKMRYLLTIYLFIYLLPISSITREIFVKAYMYCCQLT